MRCERERLNIIGSVRFILGAIGNISDKRGL